MRYRPKAGDRYQHGDSVRHVLRRITPSEMDSYGISAGPGSAGTFWWVQEGGGTPFSCFFGVVHRNGRLVDLTFGILLLERDGHSALS